jgi:hypothetical protein
LQLPDKLPSERPDRGVHSNRIDGPIMMASGEDGDGE